MSEEFKVFNDNAGELQKWLGPRPGNKHVDPFWIKQGVGKVFLWDDYRKKWVLLKPKDVIYKRDDGTVGKEAA